MRLWIFFTLLLCIDSNTEQYIIFIFYITDPNILFIYVFFSKIRNTKYLLPNYLKHVKVNEIEANNFITMMYSQNLCDWLISFMLSRVLPNTWLENRNINCYEGHYSMIFWILSSLDAYYFFFLWFSTWQTGKCFILSVFYFQNEK